MTNLTSLCGYSVLLSWSLLYYLVCFYNQEVFPSTNNRTPLLKMVNTESKCWVWTSKLYMAFTYGYSQKEKDSKVRQNAKGILRRNTFFFINNCHWNEQPSITNIVPNLSLFQANLAQCPIATMSHWVPQYIKYYVRQFWEIKDEKEAYACLETHNPAEEKGHAYRTAKLMCAGEGKWVAVEDESSSTSPGRIQPTRPLYRLHILVTAHGIVSLLAFHLST